MDKVRPISRTYFDSKQNEGYKYFFRETNASISCIPMRTTHLSCLSWKKLDSSHRRSSSHFKDKLWFQTKWRLQLLFLRNVRIHIVYPNENYTFFLGLQEKKLDSIHGWSSFRFKDKFWYQTKWRLQIFFRKTSASKSCIPTITPGSSQKETGFYPRTKVISF